MERSEGVKKVAELMGDAKLCTLTTVSEGQLVSRPMGVQQVEFDGDAWFFTYDDSNKVSELEANPACNVAFQSGNSWVSLSGTGEIVHDREKMEELWNVTLKAWFPDELDEPGIALLKVHAESAEYWETSNSKVVTLIGMAKAVVTGKPADVGDNNTVQL